MHPDLPYLLLTPGPLTTTRSVKEAMLRDLSTWDRDYNDLVQEVRASLVDMAVADPAQREAWTMVPMQGSGTFSVEATLGSVVPPDGALLVVENGVYGERMGLIAARLGIRLVSLSLGETQAVDVEAVRRALVEHPEVTHVAMVHCETTTGMLNPAREVGALCRELGKVYVLDAMSSFGGIPLDVLDVGAHYLISSANKCIQGVPGFGFVICERERLAATEGWARSVSLDLFEQWREMEAGHGKWRFTSPTHVVLAFHRALAELRESGGVEARHARYRENHEVVVQGMQSLGFELLLPPEQRSPIITSFLEPGDPAFRFMDFYNELKQRRFVIYPGKITQAHTFRIGHIGDVHPADMRTLVGCVGESLEALGIASGKP